MSNKQTIQVEDLTVAYDGTPVLRDVNVEVDSGRITAIIGPNGAGKSTLLKAILDFIEPVRGRVAYYLDGEKFAYQDIKQRIAYVPQKASVDWSFPTDALDVVLMGRYGHLKLGRRPSKEDRKIAGEKLDQVGMLDFADRQISQLSGGQRQRVFLARALAQESDIIMLDEPLAGVDVTTEKVLMNLLRKEAVQGKTVIAVHHDLNTVKDYFDDVVFLNRRIYAYGPVEDTFTRQNIAETYQQGSQKAEADVPADSGRVMGL